MLTLFAKRTAGQILDTSVESPYTIKQFIHIELFEIKFESFKHFLDVFIVVERAYLYIVFVDIKHTLELCMESGARTVND